jgi:hypothetical protein
MPLTSTGQLKQMAIYLVVLHLIMFAFASFLFVGTEYEGKTDWAMISSATLIMPHSFWSFFFWGREEIHWLIVPCICVLVTLAFVRFASTGKDRMGVVTVYFVLNTIAFCIYLTLVEKYHG